jgi:DNA invertase Pin-like site-specific DNA recombinase
MRQPVAYLRKSSVTSDRHISWDVQEAQVREVAARHGNANLTLLADWNRSGRGSETRLRAGYARLRAMIDAGEVSALYSYSLSRLARSTKELLDLAERCAAARIRIHLAKEGDLDFTSPHGRLYLTVLAAVATFEADVAGERIADAVRARRARGDYIGLAPYGQRVEEGHLVPEPAEPLEPIVAAFDAAGSCYGAARLLNGQDRRTRRGALWSSKAVGDILTREGVMYAHRPRPGAKANADWILYRLLVCPCGNVMTAMDRRRPRVTCYRARHVPDHPKPFGIAVDKLLPSIMAEAARLRPPSQVEIEDTEPTRRDAILARRSRVLDIYVSGLIDKVDRDRRLADLDDELGNLEAERRIVEVPSSIDWSAPPATINAILRAIFKRIELGADLKPVRFVWTVPEWRAP